jgi:hypothetical protein
MEDKTGRPCSTQAVKRNLHSFSIGKLRGKAYLEDVDVVGRISECISEKRGQNGVEWIHLAQDRDIVNKIMNLRVTYSAVNFVTA